MRQVSNGSSPTSDREQGYGFQFWRSRHGFYRGDGAHGQFCLVLPQYDTVIAITAGTRDMGSVMNLVWDRLVPALTSSALPANPSSHDALGAKLRSLTLAPVTGAPTSAAAAGSGRRYVLEKNQPGLEALTVSEAKGETTIGLRIAGSDQSFTAAPGIWTHITGDGVAASGAWTAADTYTLKVVRYRTPFATTYRLRFNKDDAVTLDVERNVGPPAERLTTITGSAAPPNTANF
jgi:hypothetical protein